MTNLTNIPLQDNFETTLTQEWNGNIGTVFLASVPTFTFPVDGTETYIVANPNEGIAQIGLIDSIDTGASTVNVSSISFERGAGIANTAQIHPVNSEVIISDNYQFWSEIQTSINSKLDTEDAQPDRITIPTVADPTARDVLYSSPTGGEKVFVTSLSGAEQHFNGALTQWETLGVSTPSPFASDGVAGLVDGGNQALVDAGTKVGTSGADNNVNPETLGRAIQKQSYTYDEDTGASDAYVITLSPVPLAYVEGMRITVKIGSGNTNTGASTIDVNSLGTRAIQDKDGDALEGNQLIDGQIYELIDDGTAFKLITVEKANDSEVVDGIDDQKYITSKKLSDKLLGFFTPISSFDINFSSTSRLSITNDSGGSTGVDTDGLDMGASGSGTDSTKNIITLFGRIFNGNPSFFSAMKMPIVDTNSANEVYIGIGNITVSAVSGHTFTDNHIGFKATFNGGVLSIFGTVGNGSSESTTSALTTLGTDFTEMYFKVVSSSSVIFSIREHGGTSVTEEITTNIPFLNTVADSIQLSYRAGNTNTRSIIVSNVHYDRQSDN